MDAPPSPPLLSFISVSCPERAGAKAEGVVAASSQSHHCIDCISQAEPACYHDRVRVGTHLPCPSNDLPHGRPRNLHSDHCSRGSTSPPNTGALSKVSEASRATEGTPRKDEEQTTKPLRARGHSGPKRTCSASSDSESTALENKEKIHTGDSRLACHGGDE